MGQVIGVCQLHEAGRLLSVNYMGQRLAVCHLHEAGRRLSGSYMKQDDGYL